MSPFRPFGLKLHAYRYRSDLIQNLKFKIQNVLLGNLKLSSFNYFTCLIFQVINIESSIKVSESDRSFFRNVSRLRHFLTQEIIDRNSQALLKILLNIKSDIATSGVGVEVHNSTLILDGSPGVLSFHS